MSIKATLKHLAFGAFASIDGPLHNSRGPLRELRSFLLLQHASALGTVLHGTPLPEALRAVFPEAHVTVATSGYSTSVYRDNPAINCLVEMPNPMQDLKGAAGFLRELRMPGPFATLTTVGNERSRVALACVLGGAGNRVGMTLVPELFRVPMAYDPAVSIIANNLHIVEALGHGKPPHVEPRIFPSADDLTHARGLLARFKDPTRPNLVLVTQSSPGQRKNWRLERFVAAGRSLAERVGANIVLVGAPSERASVEAQAAEIGEHAMSFAGETTLHQLAALLSLCRVGISIETGTLHVARAVGLPTVIISPAWSPPIEWLPQGDTRYIAIKNLEGEEYPEYMIDEVSVQEVEEAAERLWHAFPVPPVDLRRS